MKRLGITLFALFSCTILTASCRLPTITNPTPTLEPTETVWQPGTPEPLYAPITNICPGQQPFPPQLDRLAYGMNVFLFGTDADRVLTLTNIAGAGWIRQQIHWRDLEGQRGEYIWRPLDEMVSAARARDFNIMLSVVRSPAWATESGHSGMPDDTAAFAAFMHEVATRYRGRVSAYEIWNEPNLAHESGGVPGDPADYLATLQAAYPLIKQADPCALVLAAPMAATNDPDPTVGTEDIPFYETLYTLQDGAFLHVADVIAVHPGAGPYPPTARWPAERPEQSHYYFRHIERVHELMLRHNDQRQVWITEVGWTVTEAEGAPTPVSEQQQADYLVDMLWYVRQRYNWVDGVFLWNLNFSIIAPPDDEKTTYSLLRPDWSLRPAFLVLQHNLPALRDLDQPPLLSEYATHRFAWNFPARGALPDHPLLAPDGTIYAVSSPTTLYTISPTGTLQWAHNAAGIVSSAPARAPDGTLYLADSASLLTALLPDGTQIWQQRLRSPVRGSPVYHREHIFVVNRIGEVIAFDQPGQQAWKLDLEIETTPLALSSDGALLVGKATGIVLKIAPDGKIVWRTPVGDELWSAPVPTADGGAIIATVRGQIVRLDSQGNFLWRSEMGVPVVAAPLQGANDIIFVAARDGSVTALDGSTGNRYWRYNSGSDLRGTPLQDERGMLYVGTEDERLLAIDPEGKLRWYAHVRGSIRAQPVIGLDDTLYVATMAGRLYAFQP
jgi:outer membrane protein assembly factor BamB